VAGWTLSRAAGSVPVAARSTFACRPAMAGAEGRRNRAAHKLRICRASPAASLQLERPKARIASRRNRVAGFFETATRSDRHRCRVEQAARCGLPTYRQPAAGQAPSRTPAAATWPSLGGRGFLRAWMLRGGDAIGVGRGRVALRRQLAELEGIQAALHGQPAPAAALHCLAWAERVYAFR
jgi:hypothetical protein